jgi:HEAT repeat protein
MTESDGIQQVEAKVKLTARQRKLIPLLVSCSTAAEACEKAKLNRSTLYTWLREPLFRDEVERQREELVEAAFGMVAQNVGRAVSALVRLLDSRDERVRRWVANDIVNHFLRHKELHELEERIEAIEERLKSRQ